MVYPFPEKQWPDFPDEEYTDGEWSGREPEEWRRKSSKYRAQVSPRPDGADGEEPGILDRVGSAMAALFNPTDEGEPKVEDPAASEAMPARLSAKDWGAAMRDQSIQWRDNMAEEERVDDCISEAYEAWQLRNYEGRIYARTEDDVQEVVRRAMMYAPKESSEAFEASISGESDETLGRQTISNLRGSMVERQVSLSRTMANIAGHLRPTAEDSNGELFYSVVDITSAIMASQVNRQIVSQAVKRFGAWHENKTRKEVLREKSHYLRSFLALVITMLTLDVVCVGVTGAQLGLGHSVSTTPVLLASSCAFVCFSAVAVVGVFKHKKDMCVSPPSMRHHRIPTTTIVSLLRLHAMRFVVQVRERGWLDDDVAEDDRGLLLGLDLLHRRLVCRRCALLSRRRIAQVGDRATQPRASPGRRLAPL